MYEVETLRDKQGRILELTGISHEGSKVFKISNDNVMPTLEIFDFPHGTEKIRRIPLFMSSSAMTRRWGHG